MKTMPHKDRLIFFDPKTMKVGCVLLQAIYGGDRSICVRLDTKHWSTDPTPDMKLFRVTAEQAELLVKKIEAIKR